MFGKSEVIQLDIHKIIANPFQPRKQFSRDDLEELTLSIQTYGILQPILVRKYKDKYQVIAGERRLRAAALADLDKVPAIVKDANDMEMAEYALIENLQRADLNIFEEAEGYQVLADKFGLTQEMIAKRVGKTQSTVANKLRILKLDPSLRALADPALVTERHLRALLKLQSVEEQTKVLMIIIENQLNVRETEEMIADLIAAKESDKKEKHQIKTTKFSGDMRIYLNTIKKAVDEIKKVGVDTTIEKAETDKEYVFTIKVKKPEK